MRCIVERMHAWLPSDRGPWFGLDQPTLRFLEVHQARAVATAGRRCQDLGDCVLLHSPGDRDPFFNRLVAVRWPESPGLFDHRLAEAIALFASLDRRPYFWLVPGLSQPNDIVARLIRHGFRDLSGGYDMVLTNPPDGATVPLEDGQALLHWQGRPGGAPAHASAALAAAIVAGFGIDPVRQPSLEVEIATALRNPVFHGYVLNVEGRPVATGQRFTFDGASYLSSIATYPNQRGRGYGAAVTETLVRDSIAEGCRYVYLGVHAENERAIRLYERLGFSILGPRSADLLLE